jgi:hypothetical protein
MREGKNGENDIKIDFNFNDIAWSSDKDYKFKNIEQVPQGKGVDYRDVQWQNMEDRKFGLKLD